MSVCDLSSIMPSFFSCCSDVFQNSIRHNLSLSKGFEKVARYNPEAPSSKKGCLWAMNPDKSPKVDEELSRYRSKDLQLILSSMRYPGIYKLGFRIY